MSVDIERRLKIECNHSAAHLLQSALREVYGKEVHQAGSKVEEEKLRFDFNYEDKLEDEDLRKIEKVVNDNIRKNIKREVKVQNLSEAISSGAMALFESKYKDEVRVVSFGDVSKELCGGTHTSMTGNIGLFIIVSGEGIGKGIKRITAITGDEALSYVQEKIKDINFISKLYKVKPENLIGKIKSEINKKGSKSCQEDSLNPNNVQTVTLKSGVKLSVAKIAEISKKMSGEAIKMSDRLGGIFAVISTGDKKQVIIAVSDKAQNDYKANEIMSKLMKMLGGKGGGNKKFATGAVNRGCEEIFENIKKACNK